jgi:hypothetical protein
VNALYYNYPRYVEPINQPDERFIGGLLPFVLGLVVGQITRYFINKRGK